MKFLNCKIDLSKKVFQPRMETEYWVRKSLKELKTENGKLKIKILDIFAGSGCIGIAILKNIQNSFVDFVDISSKAIEQIKINLILNKIAKNRYKVIKSNLFEKVKEKYDFIFANPPYVALKRINQVQKEVLKNEPKEALFAGPEGMFWIEKFLKESKKYLKPRGIIYMEFDPQQKEKIKKFLEKENFQFSFHKDQFKKYRWLKAQI